MENKALGVLSSSILLLALCTHSASSKQAAQQSPPTVVQFGAPPARANPPQIPPGARQPDRLLQAGHTSDITALAFSPNGQWLAWGGYGKWINIWNAATGAEQSTLTWPRSSHEPITELLFSPDGKRLAALAAGELRIWDLQTGRKAYSLSLRSSLPLLTYSPDGKVWAAIVAGADEDSMARIEIRDAATGNILRTIPTKWYGDTGMTITRDGLLVASGTTIEDIGDEHHPSGTVEVWEVASGQLVKTSPVFSIVGPLSADGRFMATIDSSEQGKAKIVVTDLSNGQVKWTFQQQYAEFVFFSPDSNEIAVTSGASERRLNVWSIITGAAISYVHGDPNPNEPGGLTVVAFSPDGKRIAAAPYPNSSAKIWDVAAGQEVREFAGQFSVQTVAMSPDGKWLVCAAPGVTVRNPASGKIITTLTIEDADMLVFSPDGRWLAANPGDFPGGVGRSLEVWDTKNWTLAASITPKREPRQNLPVQWIAFGGPQSPQSKLGNARSLQFTADGETHTVWYDVNPLAASPDGKLLAELGHPTVNLVDLWDTNSGQRIQTFSAHKAGTQLLAFSGDSHWLLTAGQDSQRMALDLQTYQGTTEYSVKVWDVATWKERMSVSFPRILSASAILSSDGHRLAIERSGEIIELLDADSGNSLGTLAGTIPQSSFGPMFGKGNLAFSPDGTMLFQGASKSGIYVWKLPRP